MIHYPTHISERYSPIFSVIIDFEVDKIIFSSETTFFDLLSSDDIQNSQPIRFVKLENVRETDFLSFYDHIQKDVTTFSKSFISQSYETSETTNPEFSPYPRKLVNSLHYPSAQSSNPPWFQTTFLQLLKAENFLPFNFCDQPFCVIYVSVFGKSSLTANEIRPSLVFPLWMKEFVTTIPIYNIILYNANDKQLLPTIKPQSSFSDIFYLGYSEPYSMDFVGNLKIILNSIYSSIISSLTNQIQQLTAENEKNLQLKNRVKMWMKKKNPNEKVTKVLNIPYRKIIRIQLGCYLLIQRRYQEARKIFKKFISSIKELFPEQSLLAQYLMAISSLELPEGDKKFREGINSILLNMTFSKNPIFLLYVPTIVGELRMNQGNLPVSIQMYRDVIRKMSTDWKFTKMPQEQQDLFIALYNERLAGIYMESNLKRKSLLSTAVAALNYTVCNQFSHSLRCLLWIIKLLPHDQWKYLYQSALLAKAETLCRLEQGKRAIDVFDELLSMNDLSKLLQQQVISKIWSPFNDPNLHGQKPIIRLNSLLEIKNLELIDYTKPSFWGYDDIEFEDMINHFNQFFKKNSFEKVTIDDWFNHKNEKTVQKKEIIVPVNSQVYVNISVFNRYVFSIHLDKANLIINYRNLDLQPKNSDDLIDLNDSQSDNLIEFSEGNLLENAFTSALITELTSIKGLSTKKITFAIKPMRKGVFTIEKFFKNYWGYADTEIELGSLTFSAIDDLPQIEMKFIDFPKMIAVYAIQQFSVEITNSSNYSTINGFYLIFNCLDCLLVNDMTITQLESNHGMIEINKSLKPNEVIKITFFIRTLQPTKYEMKFMVAPLSTKTAVSYSIKTVQAVCMIDIESTIRNKQNNVGNHIVHCCLKGTTSGIIIYGIINKQGKFIRSINTNQNNSFSLAPKAGSTGHSWSIIGLSNEITDKSCEKWRTNFFSNEEFALLFQFPNNTIPAQAPIASICENHTINLKIEVPPIILVSLTQKATCKVKVINPIDTEEYFIKPCPIIHGESEKLADNSTLRIAGCKWVGITSTKLSKDNNFQIAFSFVAFTPGIFHVSGFYVARNPEFNNRKEIKIMQSFRVDLKK